MKKILLLLLLLACGANAQNLTFPDATFKAMLVNGGPANFTAYAGGVSVDRIDTNFDNEIQVSEAALIQKLWVEGTNAYAVTSIQGIEGFTNLTELGFTGISATSINLSGMPNLLTFSCKSPLLASATVSGMNSLTGITFMDSPELASLSISNCAALTTIIAQNNDALSAISLNLSALQQLFVDNNQIEVLNLTSCPALQWVSANNNQLTEINISGLTAIQGFNIENNPDLAILNASGCSSFNPSGGIFNDNHNIVSANFSNCSSLTYLSITNGVLSSLDLSGCTALANINVSNNEIQTFNLTGANAIETLYCNNNQITALDLSGRSGLAQLGAHNNEISSLNLTGCNSLESAFCFNNNIGTLSVPGMTQLAILALEDNPLTHLDVSGCTALSAVALPGGFVSGNFENCSSLINININSSDLSSLNFAGCTSLTGIYLESVASIAPLSSIDVSGMSGLTTLLLINMDISEVDLTGCTGLLNLFLGLGDLETIDLSATPNLAHLMIRDTQIQNIDVSGLFGLQSLQITGNPELETVFAKNGSNENLILDAGNTSLEFFCQDESAVADTVLALGNASLLNVVCNSYCSFTPGGNYNTITGSIRFDGNGNGCDSADAVQPNVRADLNDGTGDYAMFTNNSGIYIAHVGAGNFTLDANIENPELFSISPVSETASFADTNSNEATINFCISPIGMQRDVEIVIVPISPARPGFTGLYQIVIRNKGNQMVSGNFNFTYDESLLSYAFATVAPTSTSAGQLQWDYLNLQPFENRGYYFGLNVNSPTQVPPVNINDVLTFTATINPIAGDFMAADNQFVYNQTVVGSFDPNNITCIEGENVSPSAIGQYLHYVVNFENTGTAAAENIVVRVEIDPAQYDINSLQLMNASHANATRISGNVIEFIFQGINLPGANPGDPPVSTHGNVLFKIKSNTGLQEGDFVEKIANIYFDYNAPVETNFAHTIFEALGNQVVTIDQSIRIYPNPARDHVIINCKGNISSVHLFDVQGRLLETGMYNSNMVTLDVSNRQSGVYFVKVITAEGGSVEKIIKE
ncbi:MAG TPA: T9SS type A sorting domain-containing protein [Flavobacterium sp.]|jgi:hypothetical protein